MTCYHWNKDILVCIFIYLNKELIKEDFFTNYHFENRISFQVINLWFKKCLLVRNMIFYDAFYVTPSRSHILIKIKLFCRRNVCWLKLLVSTRVIKYNSWLFSKKNINKKESTILGNEGVFSLKISIISYLNKRLIQSTSVLFGLFGLFWSTWSFFACSV